MISTLVAVEALVRAVRRALVDDEARALLVLTAPVIAIGTIFYSIEERWSLMDCLYFAVMTLTTVGFGEPAPTTALSKLFTICFSLIGIGLAAATLTTIAATTVDAGRRGQTHHRKADYSSKE